MTRYAMITGASSGLGLALAEALARRGRNLILVARHRETLEPVAIELTQRFGVEVLFRACDLSQPLRLSGFVPSSKKASDTSTFWSIVPASGPMGRFSPMNGPTNKICWRSTSSP